MIDFGSTTTVHNLLLYAYTLWLINNLIETFLFLFLSFTVLVIMWSIHGQRQNLICGVTTPPPRPFLRFFKEPEN